MRKRPNGSGSIVKIKGRRKPYRAVVTSGYTVDENENKKQIRKLLGYFPNYYAAQEAITQFHEKMNGIEIEYVTFEDLYNKWKNDTFHLYTKSTIYSYEHAYSMCDILYSKYMEDITVFDLQNVIDECEKNYPILKQVKTLFKQLYSYALCYNYISDNRSKYIDLRMYKMNYKPREIKRFTGEQIELIWNNYSNKFDEIVLMLIYTGVRICELLNLHKKDVNLKERYFKVEDSKTSSGIRVVPIANKILPFFEEWYSSSNDVNAFLIHDDEMKQILYGKFISSYYKPFMNRLNIDLMPHSCRHTCASLLSDAEVELSVIQKILGHKQGKYDPYIYHDIKDLIEAIDRI